MSSSSSSSGSSSAEEITIEELRSLYKIDRDMYRKLTVDMLKEPLVCMAVMALWLFMEELGYPDIIPTLLSYQTDIIDTAFEEARLLAYHILTRTAPPASLIHMPITLRLINAVGCRALYNLYHNGTIPYIEITNKLKNLCCTLFEDIFIEAMSRTMFVTFSTDFPVTEDQLREYFVGRHGADCIERIHMQEIQPRQRRLMSAKIAFNESETVDEILGGVEAVWLVINGVRVRASKEI